MNASSDTRAVHRPGRGRVFDCIVDAIGDTPIVRLRRLPQQHGVHATILAKLEYFSPAASVKAPAISPTRIAPISPEPLW
jgi:cysteine synthase A